ncbi:3-phosphoshikimate 1-carboxyvinyltransferase [Athalassotoga saccharophila]|uniref:3-phosphoshikimate 1-carboxyvinyltransferase n=1 Tax=Athalassotoga saccharophila TaxID=1441386 RepID=UPI00137A9128|nr:3-phosphoshikimate 1-carboxyvinyltransferase [Athalassotoga saccharophila]BBJ28078.1 3-phosphoshikimate 1-carboxyvinyltransferase 1 [Athalassotoga saccharophila]
MKIQPAKSIRGEIKVPPDKSITHRMIFFAAMAKDRCEIENPLMADDTLRTLDLVKNVGSDVEYNKGKLSIRMEKISEPISPIFCGNSGTTARLGLGFLSRLPLFSVIYGDESLSSRPMDRVVEPLSLLGSIFDGRNEASNLPISVRGGIVKHANYRSKVASAQVKSAFIIAATAGDGVSTYTEPITSRDHTERFLNAFGITIKKGNLIEIKPSIIPSFKSRVVGDFSSAAFFVTLGVCHRNAILDIKDVGLNETRTGFLNVLKRMGAKIEIRNVKNDFEPYGDLHVESSNLEGTEVLDEEIPSVIDEIPLIALLGVFAKGRTVVRGASELRKKESDRIKAIVSVLSKMGVHIEEFEDGFEVEGSKLEGAKIDPYGDHRIAMMAAIAGLCGNGVELTDPKVVSISYPSFFEDLEKVER